MRGGPPASRLRGTLLVAGEALIAAGVLFAVLRGWSRDFRVPVAFTHDAVFELMQVKGTLENGWWWVQPRLSAPGVFEQILFPSNTTVDHAIVWLLGRFSDAPGLVINLAWLVMIAAGAVIASACLRVLGIPRVVAAIGGLLFALAPYSLSRNIDHFSLVTYLIPVPCTIALLAAGPPVGVGRAARIGLLAGCVLVGFNYTYYAFFGCFVLITGAILAAINAAGRRRVTAALACAGVIGVCTAVNLAPSVLAWQRSGRPAAIPVKHAAEADRYGLTLRDLVSPIPGHTLPVFTAWGAAEQAAGYVPEPEARWARLGVLGTLGLLSLLAVLFVPRLAGREGTGTLPLASASRLTLACLLLGIVGGFGSLFNLFVAPDIRAYARLSAWIGFFGVFALAVGASRALAWARPRGKAVTVHGGLLLAGAFGLWDQSHAASRLNREHAVQKSEWESLHTFVAAFEARLPAGTRVFQLPVLTFLNENGREDMKPYDHVKPYLASHHLHWSYPALEDRIVRWQQQVGRLPNRALAAAVHEAGFGAILIDRHGFADRGDSLILDLTSGDTAAVLAESDRYLALDLNRVRRDAGSGARLPRVDEPIEPATGTVPECPASTASGLDLVGASRAPFRARPATVPARGEFAVTGWAVDQLSGGVAGDVDVEVAGRLFPTFYGTERPDVADALGTKAFTPSGFFVRLQGADVGEGVQVLRVRVLAASRSCFFRGSAVDIVAR